MKLLISADMEGISGIVDWEQVTPGHVEYQSRSRKLMTGDVNAAIQGAFEGGADEVIVSDGHWNARNILLEELDSRAKLNAGSPSPFAMMQGIDDQPQPDAAMLVGYHATAGTKKAILDHTWSDSRIRAVYLNDRLMGEIGLNAAVAAHYNVPVIALTGDQHACQEGQDMIGSALEIAVVKNATGQSAAQCLPLAEARHKICEAAARAVIKFREGKAAQPFKVETPVRLAVEFVYTRHCDRAFLIPGTERISGTRLEYTAPDMITAHRAFRAMATISRD
ncbi:MAG: M55 family metallopeptidase [Chloroflexi bacterium]|nr:M55 family metallopeptidase [Chloroflexota bacterium]